MLAVGRWGDDVEGGGNAMFLKANWSAEVIRVMAFGAELEADGVR